MSTRPDPGFGLDHPVARRLAEVAVTMIDERGEAGLRVQDVVAEAGVQIPVLYRHFGSREGLIQAAQVARLFDDLDTEMSRVEAALSAATSGAELRDIVERILDQVADPERRQVRWRRVDILGSTWRRPELASQVARAQQLAIGKLADALRDPAERGWLCDGFDPDAFSRWFSGAALSRFTVEVGTDEIDEGFEALWRGSVLHLLFG